eukprot:CAMPEP_0117535322 /NCGR_PEP_ID=MMETSP0784-20121206/40873_1 /TAXON_ID=39447 /ORGANISM="" /LENGTH=1222 /DNA_ID=CAMNT_0005331841 /DNA_START=73 /DNA_END=3741 /DNA_ORIENTATION=-
MVKFGHHLEAASALLCEVPELRAAFPYKNFKKLLRCTLKHGDGPAIVARSAVQSLQSDYWVLPPDEAPSADSAEPESGIRWFAALFQQKFREEESRIRGSVLAVQARLKEMRASLEPSQADGVCPVRSILRSREEMTKMEHQLNSYIHLNYMALCKIIKKFCKAWSPMGHGELLSWAMPFVEHSYRLVSRQKGLSLDDMDSAFDALMQQASVSDRLHKQMQTVRAEVMIKCMEIMHEVSPPDKAEDGSESEAPHNGGDQRKAVGDRRDLSLGPICRQATVALIPPIFRTLRLGYGLKEFQLDFTSALLISVAGIPKAMSYAALTGLPMVAGIKTLYVPCLIYAILGQSRHVAMSPQSVTCLLLAQMVDDMMNDLALVDEDERVRLSMLHTFFTGVVICTFGAFKLTFLLDFISKPVLSGFVSASGIIAAASTLKNLLKIDVNKSPYIHVTLGSVAEKLPEVHASTALISAIGLAMIVFIPMIQRAVVRKLEARTSRCARWGRTLISIPAVLLLVLVGILLGGQLCSFEAFTYWEPEHVVVGRGASSMALFHDLTKNIFDCDHYKERVSVEYEPSGSGNGLASMLTAERNADFGNSDKPPSPTDLAEHDIAAFPMVTSLICPVANFPLVHNSHQVSLVLDMATLAAIFSGDIDHWTDPRVRELNPNLRWNAFPDHIPINVVVRSDSSGTTQAVSEALHGCTGCNRSSVVPGLKVDWGAPRKIHVKGNRGVVEAVYDTEWTLGYATHGEVMRAMDDRGKDIHCAALHMRDGISTVAHAWSNSQAWPLTLTTFALVPQLGAASFVPDLPRRDACYAREMLHTYMDELYSRGDLARQVYMQVVPRPPSLDSILCTGRRQRRLAAGSCPNVAPTCGDVKMVGYFEASLASFGSPFPEKPVVFGTILINALLLASVALLEHVANVKLYADRHDYTVSLSADLVATGLCNIAGSYTGSFIVAAGFSRSALNKGAATQLSGLIAVFLSFGIVLVAAPALSMLPVAVLNVVLFVSVVPLVDWRLVKQLVMLRRRGARGLIMMSIAFFSTLFLGVVQGMVMAIACSLMFFIFFSTYPTIVELWRVPGSMHYEELPDPNHGAHRLLAPKICASDARSMRPIKVIRFEAPLWFANERRLTDRVLREMAGGSLRALILDMSAVSRVDISGGFALTKLLARTKESGVEMLFACAQPSTRSMILAVTGCDAKLFHDTIFEAETAIGVHLAAAGAEAV